MSVVTIQVTGLEKHSWPEEPIAVLITLFHHMALGLRVVVEDYVHSDWAKISAVVAISCACFALAVVGIVASLRIAFDSCRL